MKIIFSRKGFDSQYGGVPSPIFDDGTVVSLPIPSKQGRPLSSIDFESYPLASLVSDLTGGRLGARSLVHLDPDLCSTSVARRTGWRPSFGQVAAAQGHLAKQGVGVGDVFLFFGWFRRAERLKEKWRFVPGSPSVHSLFGWLQVDEVLQVSSSGSTPRHRWLHDHPHIVFANDMKENNAIYIGAKTLFDGVTAGAGTFRSWSPKLRLTADGASRSVWRLPSWMSPEVGGCSLTYHLDPKRWNQEGDVAYLRTVAKGQEFVMDVGDLTVARKWLCQMLDQ